LCDHEDFTIKLLINYLPLVIEEQFVPSSV